jgi:hypothetical protein
LPIKTSIAYFRHNKRGKTNRPYHLFSSFKLRYVIMAYTKVSLDHYNDNIEIVNRLAKVNNTFVYGDNISLAITRAACEEENRLIQLKHDLLEQADAIGPQIIAAAKKADANMSNLRNSIGMQYGKDSDEYVFAGGIRKSDIIEKGKTTRQNNKKGSDDKK